MDIQAEKLLLIERILQLQDETIIEQLQQWLRDVVAPPATAIDDGAALLVTPDLRARLAKSEQDIAEGKVLEHEEVVELFRQWQRQ